MCFETHPKCMLDPKLDCFREMRLFELMIFSDDSYVRIEFEFAFIFNFF